MRVVVIADEIQQQELMAQGISADLQVLWQQEISAMPGTDCYIDLLFTGSVKRIEALQQLQSALVIINDITNTEAILPGNFVRINAWPGFLQRTVVEATSKNEAIKKSAEKVFACFNKTSSWVPAGNGFIAARVVSMIINEAYLALEEGVSSKEEIDIAMKLGTSYPYGPFEWGNKIGLKNVYKLLSALSADKSHYKPSALLKKEAE